MKIELKNDVLSLLDYELIPLDKSIPEAEPVKQIVDQLISELESTFGIPFFSKAVAYAQDNFEEVANLNSSGMYDTPVGNLITAAYLNTMKTDIALITGGSTAQKIYTGPVTPVDIFRMIGYGFNEKNGLGYRIATFDITGEELWKGIETCVSQMEINDELLAQVSGMRYLFNINNPAGERVEYIEVNGKMIDPTTTYSVASNEFLINAFPMFGINISNIKIFEELTEFEVVLNYVIAKESLVPEIKTPVTGLEEEQSVIPNQHKLEQNFPNPFNPHTTISYQIADPGFVELKVYNSLGQLISTLVNKEQSAGHYNAIWNAENFASGIYFYQMKCGNFSEIKKMLFIK
jgi:2',3'-cyclic-nucleotide 2'-phosphodiesterase (5'-nucleotidase family)